MKVPQEIKDKPTQVIQSQSYYEVSRTQVLMNHQVLMEHLSLRIDILARESLLSTLMFAGSNPSSE